MKLQATYKMKKQKSIYGEMLQRAETARKSQELAAERAMKNEATSEKNHLRAMAGVNHLEIPAELAFVFSKLDNWTPVNSEKNLAKVSGRIPQVVYAFIDVYWHLMVFELKLVSRCYGNNKHI